MGKRSSGTFKRKERDFYSTPKEAVEPLLEHLPVMTKVRYAEPCCGEGDLIRHISELSGQYNVEGDPQIDCVYAYDIMFGRDALTTTKENVKNCHYIITNPPWDRKILHPMIDHFRNLLPTWLLFDSDWMHTRQAIPYLSYCSHIVSVGRVKWIPDSKFTGKDNACWYQFHKEKQETRFYGRQNKDS